MAVRLCPRAVHYVLASRNVLPIAIAAPSRCTRHVRRFARTLSSSSRPRINPARCRLKRSYHYFTDVERGHERLIQTAIARVEEFDKASKALSEGSGVQEAIELTRIMKDLGGLKNAWEEYLSLRNQLRDTQSHLSEDDPEIREMFQAEHKELCEQLNALITDRLPSLLLPTPSTSTLPVIMSLNAGVGGTEAQLCTDILTRMYQRLATSKGWEIEIISSTEGAGVLGMSGLKEITMRFTPPAYGGEEQDMEVYGTLQWEKGVHRVQRIPDNDSMGRVQTSTVNVYVLPIYPDTPDAVLVDPKDVKTETMRSRGAGGQHVNKTESAIRLTHEPTGITVSMQDSRSQHQNREWAWEVLRARLFERKREAEVERRRASRTSQIKAGATRSDRQRTYNFNQDRVTDHRINMSWGNLDEILDGNGFEGILDALKQDFRDRRLDALMAGEEDLDE